MFKNLAKQLMKLKSAVKSTLSKFGLGYGAVGVSGMKMLCDYESDEYWFVGWKFPPTLGRESFFLVTFLQIFMH